MGGCTSKQEISNTRSMKNTSSDQTRRRRRREVAKREKKIELNQVKEAKTEWRKERKKLQEEMKKIKNKAEESEYWKWVVEQLCVERAVRDEAIEKWKQLYLTIKTELDHLINTTSGDQALLQKIIPEEEGKTVEELRKEVSVKEEIIESLKGRIALMDKLKFDKERESDLLRQSLRILETSKKNKAAASSYTSRNLLILKTKCVQCT